MKMSKPGDRRCDSTNGPEIVPALEAKDPDGIEQDEQRADLVENGCGDRAKDSETGQHNRDRNSGRKQRAGCFGG